MKLNELLSEGMFWNRPMRQKRPAKPATRGEYGWHGDIKFKKQMNAIKKFLQQYPIPSLVEVYKSAAQTGKFATGDLKRVRRFMAQHNWDKDAISVLKF